MECGKLDHTHLKRTQIPVTPQIPETFLDSLLDVRIYWHYMCMQGVHLRGKTCHAQMYSTWQSCGVATYMQLADSSAAQSCTNGEYKTTNIVYGTNSP